MNPLRLLGFCVENQMSAPKEQNETPNRRSLRFKRPAASVNMEELRELIALLRDNGLAELELENEGFRVRLRRDSGSNRFTSAFSSFALLRPLLQLLRLPPPVLVQRIRARRHQQKLLRIRIYTSFRLRLWARSIVRLLRPRSLCEDRQ